MSLTEWSNRVMEAEAELRCVADERAEVERATEAKQQAIRKHKEAVRRDKAALTKKLQELEKDALDLAARTEAATKARDEAESSYHDAMNAYESLHDLVKAIKGEEVAIASRPDLDKQLEQESVQWAEEEHSLRSQLHTKEQRLKEVRKGSKARIGGLEEQIKALEASLAADREQRQKEAAEMGVVYTPMSNDAAVGSGQQFALPARGGSRKRPTSPLRDRTNGQTID